MMSQSSPMSKMSICSHEGLPSGVLSLSGTVRAEMQSDEPGQPLNSACLFMSWYGHSGVNE
jgi:hypothetical protein